MPFFNWSDEYSVGVAEMDSQHQVMVEIINRLHDAMRAGKGSVELKGIIAEMVKYTDFHFSSEEKLLQANHYPELTKQKAEHAGFERKVAEFQEQVVSGKLAMSIEVLNFIKSWWTNHIQGEDQKYSAHLAKKKIV
jgi:hemerythrin